MKKLSYLAMTAAMLLWGCGGGTPGLDVLDSDSGDSTDYRIKYYTVDSDNDGVSDSRVTISYDSEGYMSAVTFNSCVSGDPSEGECTGAVFNHRFTLIRNSAKDIITMTKTYADTSFDTYAITYDGSGHISTMFIDAASDKTITYTTDSNGDITRSEIDKDGDLLYDDYTYEDYYMAGKPYHYEYNVDNNGSIDYRKDYGYDSSARMTSCASDNDSDTDYDEYFTYSYSGNLMTKVEVAPTFGGTPDRVSYITYESGEDLGTKFMWLYIQEEQFLD